MHPILLYIRLLKIRIAGLVLVTCSMGVLLAAPGRISTARFAWTLFGIALLAGGACALNQYRDRFPDTLMERTRCRPLPAGEISPANAVVFGITLLCAGFVVLIGLVNLQTAFLGVLSALLYVLVYTPLKKISWINTSIGAIPGAIPPLMGSTAASGGITMTAWILFCLVFFWQHIHFYAIAWIFKDEYRKAGFRMLPAIEPDGESTFRQILVAASALIPASLLLSTRDITGLIYLGGALLVGSCVFILGIRLYRLRSLSAARTLVVASICYFPSLLALVIAERLLRI
jgi:heme o synthase